MKQIEREESTACTLLYLLNETMCSLINLEVLLQQ